MAAATRSERQFMRQRGAGTRDNSNAVINIDFGLKDARQERQFMRQRGAGYGNFSSCMRKVLTSRRNRKVDKIDFGFSFPTPVRPRRSVSKTPQTVTGNVGRSSEPPQRSSREPSTVRSVRYSSVDRVPPVSRPRRSLRNRQSLINIEGLASASREPPSEDGRIIAAQIFQGGVSPLAATPNRIFTLREQEVAAEDGQPAAQKEAIDESTPQPESPLFVPQDDDKENEEVQPVGNVVQPKRKKRKSVIQHVGRKKRRSSEGPTLQSIVAISDGPNPVPSDVDDDVHNATEDEDEEIPEEDMLLESSREDSLPLNGDSTKAGEAHEGNRRKRKSAILDRTSTSGAFAGVFVQGRDVDDSQHETASKAKSQKWVPGHSVAMRRLAARRRGSRMSISASPEPRDATELEGDETYIEEEHTSEPPTPAPRRNAKSKARSNRNSTGSEDSSGRRPRKTKGATFPILTYRMTNLAALPTITEEDEGGQGSDAECRPALFTDRTTPNGVDVFAQICRETIESAITNFEAEIGSNTSRAEIRRKRTALENYSKTLDQRLFDMSEAVEKRLNLEVRLRKTKREKAELQARWLNLRQQRETLALKADDIRRQNWESDERSKRQQEISELAYRTELEVEREDSADINMEFLLRTVAGTASVLSNEGGILGTIKAFNARLEGLVSRLGA